MNYYEHHIGDYAEATAHLTFIEDASYTRLIRKYYATEKPLPADKKAVQRLVVARTKKEREAVSMVLDEFFTLEEDGWHNARCDEEIARYKESDVEREQKKAHEKERMRRYRDKRTRLFTELRELGITPKWDTSIEQLREILNSQGGEPATQTGSEQERTCNAPATAIHNPITIEEKEKELYKYNSKKKASRIPLCLPPEGLDTDAWERWITYRKAIHKPIKSASFLAAKRKLAEFGCEQSAVVEQSIANGYQGLFALKKDFYKQREESERSSNWNTVEVWKDFI